jgi:UDP-2,3-diacylglucosamine pyrophosphatase LpxH
VDENRAGGRHPVVRGYRTGSASAPRAESSRRLRSSWISDFYLGTKSRKANALLDFLCSHYAEILYLIGDIVDGWNSGRWYWSPVQNAMAREIVDWGWRNARILFPPGCRRVRFKLDRRPLRTYLKRFLSKAANCLTPARFNEVRL